MGGVVLIFVAIVGLVGFILIKAVEGRR